MEPVTQSPTSGAAALSQFGHEYHGLNEPAPGRQRMAAGGRLLSSSS